MTRFGPENFDLARDPITTDVALPVSVWFRTIFNDEAAPIFLTDERFDAFVIVECSLTTFARVWLPRAEPRVLCAFAECIRVDIFHKQMGFLAAHLVRFRNDFTDTGTRMQYVEDAPSYAQLVTEVDKFISLWKAS